MTTKRASNKTPGKAPRRSRPEREEASAAGVIAQRHVHPHEYDDEHDTVQDQQPVLRFTPDAWAKLLWLRDRGATEVGGFGITAPDDPLRIVQFVTVRQQCSAVSVQFDDEAVAEYFEDQLEAGRRPEQFARLWIHTHPGSSATPSALDEATFSRVFGVCDWAVMLIVARDGATYARLRFNVGPGGDQRIPVRVDHAPPFNGSDESAWDAEYRAHVEAETEPTALYEPFDELEAVCPDDGDARAAMLDAFAIDPEVLALLHDQDGGRADALLSLHESEDADDLFG